MQAIPMTQRPVPDGQEDGVGRAQLGAIYREVRRQSEVLCAPLAVEDYVIQTMPDVSPPKWHLAHTSWFFEQFVLTPFEPGYRLFHPRFGYLFNSYYETVGEHWRRPRRGLLSRPTVDEVYRYRHYVDEQLMGLLETLDGALRGEVERRIRLGIHHEQQHQELLLTDIKHIFATNPLRPVYGAAAPVSDAPARVLSWCEHPGGVHSIGFSGAGFAYDNETPAHRVYLADYRIASRLATNGEYLAFMTDGGYTRPELLAFRRLGAGAAARLASAHVLGGAGRALVAHDAGRHAYGGGGRAGVPPQLLRGRCLRALERPASAQRGGMGARRARPSGDRQPARVRLSASGPGGADTEPPAQLYGDVWEWTASPYMAYPGYRSPAGALGEYNGKFMCNQLVLRGGSCVTPASHIRASYRNFFFPADRWQFSGVRLAEDGSV